MILMMQFFFLFSSLNQIAFVIKNTLRLAMLESKTHVELWRTKIYFNVLDIRPYINQTYSFEIVIAYRH